MAYYNNETIEAVKSISALQYMLDNEPFNLVKKGHTYFLKQHDSLYFSNGKWRWSSQGLGGNSALSYLQAVQDMKFTEAMALLCDLYHISSRDNIRNYEKVIEANKERNQDINIKLGEVSDKEFVLPPAAPNSRRIYAYLKKRGISDDVIRYCLKNRLIYQEAEHGNCVFVGYDTEGQARYAGLRSTGYVSFKGDAAGSNKKYSFRLTCAESETVHVFEAPIDLLSYATYMQLNGYDFRDTNLLALSGVAVPAKNGEGKIPDAIETLLENNTLTKFVLHLDNDATGKAAALALGKMLSDRGYSVVNAPVPEEYGKDVNDYLISYIERTKTKAKEPEKRM